MKSMFWLLNVNFRLLQKESFSHQLHTEKPDEEVGPPGEDAC